MVIDLHTHYVPEALAAAFRNRQAPPFIETLDDGSESLHMPHGRLAMRQTC